MVQVGHAGRHSSGITRGRKGEVCGAGVRGRERGRGPARALPGLRQAPQVRRCAERWGLTTRGTSAGLAIWGWCSACCC